MTATSTEVTVSPLVLVWARTQSGLSIPEAAQRVGIEPDRLSQWEDGHETPSISKLEHLADVYHRPMATFLLKSPPHEAPSPPDLRVIAERGGESTFSEKTLLAIRRARRVQRATLELAPDQVPNVLPRLRRLSAQLTPEAAAARIAGEIGAYDGDPPRFANPYQAMSHWRTLLERLGILVLQFRMPLEDARGFTISDGERPVIVVNQSDLPRARNFTMFHELGHLLRKSEGVCDLGGDSLDGPGTPVEAWCNAFAGSFLVPQASLVKELKPWPKGEEPPLEEIKRLSSRYQVSETSVLRRLLSAGFISPAQYRANAKLRKGTRSGRTQRESSTIKLNIPVERVAQYGAPFVSLVLKSASEGRLALSDAADVLDVRVKHLAALSDRAAEVLTRT
jgi:Zn-dependent peptidase ImmA (M78 family)/transcriptional regulator with XRE-family HTH domain